MQTPIITPKKTRWESFKAWCKSWSPQVKQAVIGGLILISLTVAGWCLWPKSQGKQVSQTMNNSPNSLQVAGDLNISHDKLIRSFSILLSEEIVTPPAKAGPEETDAGLRSFLRYSIRIKKGFGSLQIFMCVTSRSPRQTGVFLLFTILKLPRKFLGNR